MNDTLLRRRAPIAVALAASLVLAGCATIRDYMPSIPPPSFDWMMVWSSKSLGTAPETKNAVSPKIVWRASVAGAGPGFAPAITESAIYAAARDGTVVRVNPANGEVVWRINAGRKLAAGVGADDSLVVVGTDKGEVLAFDTAGKLQWDSKITSEVVGPPEVADGLVVAWAGDGSAQALNAKDGKTKWAIPRVNPPLTVRNYAGGVAISGALFVGTAGGKLLAIDLGTGAVGWEAAVATPKGATELERIADVTSLPVVIPPQVCAVAFQGRVACFEVKGGGLTWSREISSIAGMTADERYLYVTDAKGSVQALDRSTGSSVWKQDKLEKRRIGGPQVLGAYVAVVDAEGLLYLMDPADGTLVGRLATGGKPATAQPAAAVDRIIWQSEGGELFAVSAR